MLLSPLAGLVLVIQYPDAIVLQQNTVLVAVRLHWILSERALCDEHSNANYYFPMHLVFSFKVGPGCVPSIRSPTVGKLK